MGSVKSSVSKEQPYAWEHFNNCPIDQKLYYDTVFPLIKVQTNIPIAEFYELLKFFLNEFNRLFITDSFELKEYERLSSGTGPILKSAVFYGPKEELGWRLWALLQSLWKFVNPMKRVTFAKVFDASFKLFFNELISYEDLIGVSKRLPENLEMID